MCMYKRRATIIHCWGYAEIQRQYSPLLSSAIKLTSTEYDADDGCVFAGENVVGGDKESVKNLLEIFDGLLEYLKEEISEESQNGGRQIHCHFSLINLMDKMRFYL